MEALFIIFASLLFLCFGSAIGVYVKRTPKYEEFIWRKEAHEFLGQEFNESAPASFFEGRSECPNCHHKLSIRDLIPLISFLISKRHCRHCHTSIPWFYFNIEIATLLLCLPLVWLTGSISELIVLSLIFCTLLTISIIDWQHQWIPDQLNVFLLGLALLQILLNQPGQLSDSVIAMMIGYGFIAGIRQLYLAIRKVEAIGLGDAKLLAALGAWQGVEGLFYIVLYGSILGIIFALVSQKNPKQTIAFGPFLCIASIINFTLGYLP